MNNFLPEDYKDIPDKNDRYMRFQDGANRFRVLDSAIVGWIGWKTNNEGTRKPIRKRMNQTISVTEIDEEEKIKHFWAFPVWNYEEQKVQILEITQKSIQKDIKSLTIDGDWGSPKEYDLVITKTGQKLETRYQVTPKPKKKLDEGITTLYQDMTINLEALYDGLDPFEVINPD